jgi:glycosyltransferase involved in cell wall biosynthesis
LRLLLHEGKGWRRYPLSAWETAKILRASRGKAVFVQNPSMVLAVWAGILKPVFGYTLIVDRHSNFPFLSSTGAGTSGWKRLVSGLLSDLSLRLADLTIVTNPELAVHVERRGGRPLVLPDPFPRVPASALEASAFLRPRPPDAPKEVLFVSSWAFDEPLAAVMEACRGLRGKVNVRVTGRPKPAYADMLREAPDNFIPTGFLSEQEYFALMAKCDAVIAVTSRSCTLVCGAYEAIVLGKPMILGGSPALREYFDEGAAYTDGSAADMVRALNEVLEDLPARREAVRRLLERRAPEWEGRLDTLEYVVDWAVATRRRTPSPHLEYAIDAATGT